MRGDLLQHCCTEFLCKSWAPSKCTNSTLRCCCHRRLLSFALDCSCRCALYLRNHFSLSLHTDKARSDFNQFLDSLGQLLRCGLVRHAHRTAQDHFLVLLWGGSWVILFLFRLHVRIKNFLSLRWLLPQYLLVLRAFTFWILETISLLVLRYISSVLLAAGFRPVLW